MSILSARLHGALDYTVGGTLVCMPWFMGLGSDACATWLAITLGSCLVLYSFCTDYALGYLEEIDFRTHLLLDFLVGIALSLSPWLFGFYDKVYLPFVITGAIQIISTAISKIDQQHFSNRRRNLSSNKTLAGI